MRMMSFALTERQLMDGSKTVTRRTGWEHLTAGARLLAVRKAMGLKRGEKAVALCEIEVVSVRREPLCDITSDDVTAEGFPQWTKDPAEFVALFCKDQRVPAQAKVHGMETRMRAMRPNDLVTRIEFRKVPGSERAGTQTGLAL